MVGEASRQVGAPLAGRPQKEAKVRRATWSLLGGAVLAVLLPAWPAWAHAEFEGSSTVPTGSARVITLKVPEEQGPDLHITTVVIDVPAGLSAVSCQSKAGWKCGASDTPAGGALVTFTRTSGTSSDSLFRLTLLTPAQPGDYAFKVSQTYGDGKVVIWDGPKSSDTPAPVLTVVAGPVPAQAGPAPAPPASTPAPSAQAAPHTSAAAPATTPAAQAAALPAPTAAPAASTEADHERGDDAATLPRTGPDRGLLALAGVAIALGGLGIATGQRRLRRA